MEVRWTHMSGRAVSNRRGVRRLVKTDRDKHLIKLSKTRDQLRQQKKNLPMVPLEHPYQRGWKRLFVLRDDTKRGPRADFYETLIKKINTVQYHHDLAFKFKKRRKRRYGYTVKKQELCEIGQYYWDTNRLELSEQELACFTQVSFVNSIGQLASKYVFTEPWHFVLKVMPHMITQVKLHDEVLQQKISEINKHIENHFCEPRIYRLTVGKRYRRKDEFNERSKY